MKNLYQLVGGKDTDMHTHIKRKIRQVTISSSAIDGYGRVLSPPCVSMTSLVW